MISSQDSHRYLTDRETQEVLSRFTGALFKVDEISGSELGMLRVATSAHSASGRGWV